MLRNEREPRPAWNGLKASKVSVRAPKGVNARPLQGISPCTEGANGLKTSRERA